MTESIIEVVMPLTGFSPFQLVVKDLKPAVQNAIKPVLDKVKNKVGAKEGPDSAPAPPPAAAAQPVKQAA